MKHPTMNQYLNSLDNSSWLQHIKAVLDAAIFIARVKKKSFYLKKKRKNCFFF